LGARGYNRDGKKGKLQINYGLLTDRRGCPVSVSVFAGNVADPPTLLAQVETLRARFGIREIVLVGDRGMLTQTQIEVLKQHAGIDWIGALEAVGKPPQASRRTRRWIIEIWIMASLLRVWTS
jgi:transposase